MKDADTKGETLSVAAQEQALRHQLEELQRTKAMREQIEALDKGWLPQGVRLVDFGNREEGRTISFTDEEAAILVKPIRTIIEARLKGAV